MIKFMLVLMGCLWMTAVSAESRAETVAVMDLDLGSGVEAGDAQAIADRLETELIRQGVFSVLERRRVGSILQEQGFQQSGVCDEASCRIQVGQLLGVDRMVVGSLSKVGVLYSLNAKLLDVGTGEILRSHAIDVSGDLSQVLTKACAPMAAYLATGNASAVSAIGSSRGWWIAGGVALLAATGIGVYVLSQDASSRVTDVDRTLGIP